MILAPSETRELLVFTLVMSPFRERPVSAEGSRGMWGLVLGKLISLFEPGLSTVK